MTVSEFIRDESDCERRRQIAQLYKLAREGKFAQFGEAFDRLRA